MACAFKVPLIWDNFVLFATLVNNLLYLMIIRVDASFSITAEWALYPSQSMGATVTARRGARASCESCDVHCALVP
jgi:hypothetical protein